MWSAWCSVALLVALGLSGCATETGPVDATADVASAPAAPRPTCEVEGDVPVTIHLWRDRAGEEPVAREQVVAVDDPARERVGSGIGGCRVSATTDADGTAMLQVPDDQPFYVLATLGSQWHGAAAGPFDPAPGMVVDVLQYDTSYARTRECDRPDAPRTLPDHHQFATDLVPVNVTVIDNRDKTPMDVTVAAVDVEAKDISFPDRFFSDCVLAIGSGTARTLWLKDGEEVRFFVDGSIFDQRIDAERFTVRRDLDVELPRYDPVGARLGDCGRPVPPLGFPDDQAYAREVVRFEVHAKLDDVPVAGLQLSAIDLDHTQTLDSFGLGRFFTECVLAEAKTNDEGVATLYLPPDEEVHVVVRPWFDDPVGALWHAQAREGTAVLELEPVAHTYVYESTVSLPLPTHIPITFDDDPGQDRALRERLQQFNPTLSWHNDEVFWADLWFGMAVGEGTRWTSDVFDSEQGPGDGDVDERLLGAWSDYDEHRAAAVEGGLSAEVVSPDTEVFAPLGLPVTLTFEARFALPSYYDGILSGAGP